MKSNPYALKPDAPCRICGNPIQPARANLEKTTCIDCQADLDKQQPVKHTIVPLNKSNYVPITDLSLLAQLNPKHTA
jgi:hypothetical protein